MDDDQVKFLGGKYDLLSLLIGVGIKTHFLLMGLSFQDS